MECKYPLQLLILDYLLSAILILNTFTRSPTTLPCPSSYKTIKPHLAKRDRHIWTSIVNTMDPENNSVTQPNFHVSKEDHPFCFLPRQHPTFTPRISLAENHYQCLKHQRDQTNNKLQQKKVLFLFLFFWVTTDE